MSPRTGVTRAVRCAALGLASAGLGAGAHVAGGGALPGPGVGVVLVALLGMVAVAATERRVRLPALTAILAVEQLGLHAALSAAGHAPAVAGGTHAAHAVTVGAAGADPMAASMAATPAMLVAHVVATALTAWLLARGEAWLWRAADRLVAVAAGPKVRRPRTRPALVVVRPAPALASGLHRSTPRRGPPFVLAGS